MSQGHSAMVFVFQKNAVQNQRITEIKSPAGGMVESESGPRKAEPSAPRRQGYVQDRWVLPLST